MSRKNIRSLHGRHSGIKNSRLQKKGKYEPMDEDYIRYVILSDLAEVREGVRGE
jgi:hypothetical protein